jgi:hypothetical protein
MRGTSQARRILPENAWWPERDSITQAWEGPSPRSFLASLSHKQRGRGEPKASTRLVGGDGTTAMLASLGGGRASACVQPASAGFSPSSGGLQPPGGGDRTLRLGDRTLPLGDRTLRLGDRTLRLGDRTLRSGDRTLPLGARTLRSGDRTLGSGDRTLALADRTLALADRTLALADRTLRSGGRTLPLADRTPGWGTAHPEGGPHSPHRGPHPRWGRHRQPPKRADRAPPLPGTSVSWQCGRGVGGRGPSRARERAVSETGFQLDPPRHRG